MSDDELDPGLQGYSDSGSDFHDLPEPKLPKGLRKTCLDASDGGITLKRPCSGDGVLLRCRPCPETLKRLLNEQGLLSFTVDAADDAAPQWLSAVAMTLRLGERARFQGALVDVLDPAGLELTLVDWIVRCDLFEDGSAIKSVLRRPDDRRRRRVEWLFPLYIVYVFHGWMLLHPNNAAWIFCAQAFALGLGHCEHRKHAHFLLALLSSVLFLAARNSQGQKLKSVWRSHGGSSAAKSRIPMGCVQSSGNSPGKKESKSGTTNAVDKQQAKEEIWGEGMPLNFNSALPLEGCGDAFLGQENKKYEETMSFLSQVPLFMRLPKDQHPILAAACVNQPFKAGQTIITQGDVGKEFFIIQSGEAEVLVSEGGSQKKVASLKQGDYFGENALLRNEPRSATIKAVSEIRTLKITQEKFKQMGLNEKIQFANRKAVGAGGKRQLVVKAPSEKTNEERQLMEMALKKNENIQTMVKLDEVRVKQIIDIAWKETVPSGKEIIAQGDLAADYFYICQSGTFEIFVADKGDESKKQLVQTVTSSFGELALLYLVPRAATVVAKEASVVWVIDRKNFKDILMKVSDEKIQEYVKYLSRVEILNSLLAAEKQQVASALMEKHFSKNDVIIQQGDAGTTFYILFEGEVAVSVDGDEKARLQASEDRGTAQYFGERALLRNEPRAATVKVVSKDAKALALDKEAFDLLLGPLEDIMARKELPGGTAAKAVAPPAGGLHGGRDPNRPKILISDLQKVGLLGAGGFGAVELWEHKATHETYAMKCISKGFIVKTGMQDSVITEKNILFMTNSDFIIRLYETYNSKQSIYFLMEPALGGELYSMYQRKGFYGSEKHAKFYTSGVLCAFDHLHERHIIYRDLKPENLLLNEKGHLKVTDMGLAKFVIGKTYTTCGTPDYFAPEVIASTGHTHAVDWWMLGVLIFEFMTGSAPFEAPYPMQIYAKVLKGINAVKFPPQLSPQCVDIIKAICQKEPADRLPMLTGGSKNIKTHAWYKGFNWDKFQDFTLEAPFLPKVKSKKDLANFSVHPDEMPRFIEYVDDGSGWDKDFATC
eukprot:symbB.v1.2.023087.t1/scaffold2089.1/size89944/2